MILLCISSIARSDDATKASRDHYARGRALYLENKNEEALREFEAGFDLVPRSEFLINIGLCQLRLGHPREARDNFQKFLAAAPENHKQRKNVEQLLQKAEAEIANLPPPQPQIEPPRIEPSPEPVAMTPSPKPAVVVVVAEKPVEKPKQSFARRNWWIFPVLGVVVAGVAVGLGVGLSQPSGCAGQKGLCVDASK
jgi:tetratricopeptide (TPR) repeat protein